MTHNLPPFIVESLRRSRPFIVVATFLSVLLFGSSVSAQTTPFTVFNETFDTLSDLSSGSWEGTLQFDTTFNGGKAMGTDAGSATLRSGQRHTNLASNSGYHRLFFDYYRNSTNQNTIEFRLDEGADGDYPLSDPLCSVIISPATGNFVLEYRDTPSSFVTYDPALTSFLASGESARYFLDYDMDTLRCRGGVVGDSGALTYFTPYFDTLYATGNEGASIVGATFLTSGNSSSGTIAWHIDNLVYQISGAAFPASGTSITTIGDSLVIPSGDYLQVNYPTNGTTTASTTITLDIDYTLPFERAYLNQMLGSFCSQVEQLNGLPDCEHFTLDDDLTIGSPTTITPSVTLDYEGAYIGFVSFWNGVEEDVECSWFDVWCEDEAQELWETQSISFSAATTTVMLVTPYYRENLIGMCDQLPLGADYICEAMVWLFVPSTDVYVNATNQVWNQMAGKIPFGFFIYAKDTLSNVVQSPATSTYDGITVDLTVLGGETAIFDVEAVKSDEFYQRLMNTLDPYAEIFIWFFFLAYIWHRFKGSHFEPPAEDNLWGV